MALERLSSRPGTLIVLENPPEELASLGRPRKWCKERFVSSDFKS